MKNKSKYLPSLILTLMTVFCGTILSGSHVGAATTGSKNVSVTVVPACYFTNESDTYTTTLPVTPGTPTNTESLTKTNLQFTCGSSAGFSIQAVGFSPNSAGGEGVLGNTVMYNPTGSIPTGTSGTSASRWAFKVTSATSSTSYTIQGNYGNYSNIPSTATDIVTYTGTATPGVAVTGTIRTDYEVYAIGSQLPGTYTGAVKYILAVNS